MAQEEQSLNQERTMIMGILDDLTNRSTEVKEQGSQIVEVGQQKLEEAGEMKSAIDGLDAIDEDAQAIIDAATEGAQEVASEVGESEIASPMEGVTEQLSEVNSEAMEASSTESSNAETISVGAGDYASVEAQAASSFEQHAEQLAEVGESAQELADEFRDQSEEMRSTLDSFF